jgi:glycosyltransferase involved in cell wall biosynthesis
VELLILGGSQSISNKDSLKKNIINMLQQQLSIQINFLGQVYEREKYFQAADIFILPSQSEGMPNALLEAMACGLACIATNVGGVPDVIRHEINGIIINYGDNKELEDAIWKLINNEYMRIKIGEQALMLIKSNYSIEIVAKEYEALLKY